MAIVRIGVEDNQVVVDGDARFVDLTGLVDPREVRSIGWDDVDSVTVKGRIIYTKEARAAADRGTEVARLGQEDFTDPTPYDPIIAAWVAAEPPPPVPVDPKTLPLTTDELVDLLISKGVITAADVQAIKDGR